MASVENNDIKMEFAMFGDIFKFYKKYYHPEDDQKYWSDVVEATTELEKKYPGQLCIDLTRAIWDEFCRRYDGEQQLVLEREEVAEQLEMKV